MRPEVSLPIAHRSDEPNDGAGQSVPKPRSCGAQARPKGKTMTRPATIRPRRWLCVALATAFAAFGAVGGAAAQADGKAAFTGGINLADL